MLYLTEKEKRIKSLLKNKVSGFSAQSRFGHTIVDILNETTEPVSFDCSQHIMKVVTEFTPSVAVDFVLRLMYSPYFKVYRRLFTNPRKTFAREWSYFCKKYARKVISSIATWEKKNKKYLGVPEMWKKQVDAREKLVV